MPCHTVSWRPFVAVGAASAAAATSRTLFFCIMRRLCNSKGREGYHTTAQSIGQALRTC